MKSYYLKRIDELNTDLPEKAPRSVSTMIKAGIGPFLPKLARKVTAMRLKARGESPDDSGSSDDSNLIPNQG